jgi:hypothetical protein
MNGCSCHQEFRYSIPAAKPMTSVIGFGKKGRSTMQPWEQPIEIRIALAQQSVLKKIADAPFRRIAA